MKSRVEIGRERELQAQESLAPYFVEVEHIGGQAPYDLIAHHNIEKYGINVKSGKKSYLINRVNLKRLIKEAPNMIPSYLFLEDAGSYLFTLKETYPPVKNLSYKRTPRRTIKHINPPFDPSEFEELERVKGDMSWHDFIMKLVKGEN